VSLADWGVFENLLNKPDAEYQIAFRLFDVERTGSVKYDDFRTLYELNKGPENIAFDWDSDWAKIYIGSKKHRHPLDYQQFSQMLRGLQGERVRQAFHQLERRPATSCPTTSSTTSTPCATSRSAPRSLMPMCAPSRMSLVVWIS
jgi:solute carrier family 25 aspartate/glutamate transporter 12/13